MSATKILWEQILTVLLIVVLTTWAATQWTAWRLSFQPQPGSHWFDLADLPVHYAPARPGRTQAAERYEAFVTDGYVAGDVDIECAIG